MHKSAKVENILLQIQKLDYEARLYLMEKVIHQLRSSKIISDPKERKLTELNSLGSEIWDGVNIEEYVQQERQWD